jgi:signal transduction histidine kinase/ligand-binding sensor domain-containing protein
MLSPTKDYYRLVLRRPMTYGTASLSAQSQVSTIDSRSIPWTGRTKVRQCFIDLKLVAIATLLVIFLLSSAGFSVALDPSHRISQYGHTAWRLQDGYFGSQPYSIAQTKDGFIWVGTQDGLFRFDGVQFVRWSFPSGEELPSSWINTLLGARDGSLWIGTDAGLARMVNNHLTIYLKGEYLAIQSLLEDREGRIWIARHGSGEKIDPFCQVLDTGIRCHGKEVKLDQLAAGPMLQDTSGNLWIGTDTTLVRWRDGESQVYQPKALVSNGGQAGVTSLAAAPDGSLWVGMAVSGRGGGLQRVVNGTLKPFVAPGLNGEKVIVRDLMLDRENTVWVGTTEGVYKIRGAEVDHFGTADGLSSDALHKLFEDQEGNLWLVTTHGVDMFRDLRMKSISIPNGRGEDEVQSILALRNGRILVGASRLLVLEREGISSELGRSLQGHMVTSLLEDHAGRLWVGMDDTLSVYEGGRFRPIPRRDGRPVGMVTGITEDSENNIWIESVGPPRTLMRIRNLAVEQEFPSPEMPMARNLVADPKGGIWLGLANGDLALYRSSKLTTFSFGAHPRALVQAIAAGADGSILGATPFGVVGWRNGNRQILTMRNGLPCNGVYALIPDNDGNQWLYTQCGLVEVPKDEMSQWWKYPETRLKLRVFDALDGVRPSYGNFSNSARTPDGRLWFANGSGLQVIDPAHIAGNTTAPPVYVNSILADRKSYSAQESLKLPALTRGLEIDYTAPGFAVPERVLFRYMLEGHDASWQEAGTRRQAFYNDLPPRKYRFRVIACNSDGVWNEVGASIDFSILPAWYQTLWFHLCCVVAFLLLVWAAYLLRVRQLEARFSAGLEARVEERTRIARDLHDTLLQSFQGAVFQFQAARKLLLRNSDNAMQVVDEAIKAAREGIAEGRAAIHDLRPEQAAQRDLPTLLNAAGRELENTQEPNTNRPSFRVTVEGKEQSLALLVQDEIYRIAREVIRNAFHHAAASLIEVEIRYDADQLRVRIRDDGNGIDPKILKAGGQPGHWGIPGMRERAQRIESKLEFWSEKGRGTEVELTIRGAVAYETRRNDHRFRLFRRADREERPRQS